MMEYVGWFLILGLLGLFIKSLWTPQDHTYKNRDKDDPSNPPMWGNGP